MRQGARVRAEARTCSFAQAHRPTDTHTYPQAHFFQSTCYDAGCNAYKHDHPGSHHHLMIIPDEKASASGLSNFCTLSNLSTPTRLNSYGWVIRCRGIIRCRWIIRCRGGRLPSEHPLYAHLLEQLHSSIPDSGQLYCAARLSLLGCRCLRVLWVL